MKPRLEPCELTPEDQIALGLRILRAGGARVICTAHTLGLYHDRLDADLMLLAQEIASCGPCSIELYGIACRGWDQAENGKLRGAL